MKKKLSLIIAFLMIVLVAGYAFHLPMSISIPVSDNKLPQVKFTTSLGNIHMVNVEVADTPETQMIGLMNRRFVKAGQGMIFIFSITSIQTFWMKDTYIPLDIIFFDSEKKFVSVALNAQPCVQSAEQCVRYSSQKPSKYVIELNPGELKQEDLVEGLHFELF